MPFIGNTPDVNFTSFAKQDITGDGGASYTLTHAVANANEIEVFVNNVRQEPTSAYSVSGTALTMTGNVASTDDFYVIYLGKALQTTVPPDGSVTSAKLGTNIAISGTLDVTGAISGTDMQLLHTTTVTSNVGEVQIDGHFTSAFKNYKLVASNVHTDTDNVNMNLKFMSGGSVISGSVHRSVRLRAVSGGSTISCQNEATDTEFAKVGGVLGNATGEQSNFEVTFYDPLATDNFKHFSAFSTNVDSNANCEIGLMSAYYNSGQAALSGFEIDPSSGNIASGIFKLYGLR